MKLPKETVLAALLATGGALVSSPTSCDAFVPSKLVPSFTRPRTAGSQSTTAVEEAVLTAGKSTGTSFLPEETIERAKKGSPIEKIKMAKDGTSAFVDVYEYARKIREGEMTWEEVEKADLDNVSYICTIEKIFL